MVSRSTILSRTRRNAPIAIAFLANCVMLAFLASTNRLVTNAEARGVSAGVGHWRFGEFEMAKDSPPLTRLVATLPLLPLGVHAEPYEGGAPGNTPDAEASPREQELFHAGRFAHINPGSYNLCCLARLTGCGWWLLGAWILVRWSRELHGPRAGWLALSLWSLMPLVLAIEQLVIPALPAAVVCLGATRAFRAYLASPSWKWALLTGLLLGVAQLTEFVALTLFVVWPVLVLAHRRMRREATAPTITPRTRTLHVVCTLTACVWVLNLGYGFVDTGARLGSLNFSSRRLTARPDVTVELTATRAVGNRFRNTWLGRIPMPVPADYLEGLDRRLHDWDSDPWDRGDGQDPRGAEASFGKAARSVPPGFLGMILASLLLRRRDPDHTVQGAILSAWLPLLVFLMLAAPPLGLLAPTVAVVLATPFGIIVASQLAAIPGSNRWPLGGLAIALSLWGVGSCLSETNARSFTIDRTTLFRQDLVRQGRKLGLTLPEPKTSTGVGHAERGLFYRSFLDSRDADVNYALFVPPTYTGNRPYPLILFLHGWGDRGTAPTDHKYTEVGLPFTLKYRPIDFLVLCPQGHEGQWNADGDDARRAMELLAVAQRDYRVDPKRIYLTGLSSGGAGVFHLAARHPERWAALVPVAGTGDPAYAPLIKDLPCWGFFNRYDGDCPVGRARELTESLRRLRGRPRHTEYADTTHRAWERAYLLPELYDWLAQQRRP